MLEVVLVGKTKPLELSWKIQLAIFVGAFLLGLSFAHFKRSALERPTMFSIVVIAFVMAMNWELRKRVWFWFVILTVAALHVLIILCVPWTATWIPAFVMTPIAAVEIVGILAITTFLEKRE